MANDFICLAHAPVTNKHCGLLHMLSRRVEFELPGRKQLHGLAESQMHAASYEIFEYDNSDDKTRQHVLEMLYVEA